jgi:hypothetical protein
MSTIFCQNCGQANADITRICRYCGTGLHTGGQSASRPTDYAPPPPQSDFGGIPAWAADPPPDAFVAPQAHESQAAADLLSAPAHFRCPHCHSTAPPIIAKRIGVTGWIVFFALLIFCFPLCFIGLFIKDEYRMCSWCRGAVA